MFAGQGSQYFRMGEALFQSNTTFRDVLMFLDKEACNICGCSIADMIYHQQQAKGSAFNTLRYTHPAIYMVQYAMAKTLQEDMGIRPSCVLGSSLGEAVAAAVSGAIDPVDMLGLVMAQSAAVERHCSKGGMITILHDIAIMDTSVPLQEMDGDVTLVSVNYSGHFTLAASAEAIDRIKTHLDQRSILYGQFPVEYAFHSPMIEAAKYDFIGRCERVGFSRPLIPVISGFLARQISSFNPLYLWQTVREPIRFSDSIRYLEETGANYYIDCSPSGTLQTICSRVINRHSASMVYPVMSQFRQELKNLQLLRLRPDISRPAWARNSL